MLAAQVTVCILIVTLPALTVYLSTRDMNTANVTLQMVALMLMSPMLMYFLNYYVMWRWFFDKRRYTAFVIINLAVLWFTNYGILNFRQYAMSNDIDLPVHVWVYWGAGILIYFLLITALIVLAIAQRQYMKTRRIRKQLEEEKQKSTEAELAWLKNQINPHFLFNTLNNISSLTQIDTDKAQDAIAQLSDLLRYAMYETNKPMVPVGGEVEFMRNYIELMRLRCSDRTTVSTQFAIGNNDAMVAPLLFISLVENAFKHGVSGSKPSRIDISMTENNGRITFRCDNTNYPKDNSDRSGSGIGLENTRRRLQLLYTDRYEWQQSISDGIYHVSVTINDK